MNYYQFRVRISLHHEGFYLTFLSIFCFLQLAIRMYWTNTFEYRFMGINLLLAWIPYLLSLQLNTIMQKKNLLKKGLLLFFWLLFFPNAAYMITDLFHLSEFPSMPMWYDLIMLLSFAWCGLLLGFYSLKRIHRQFIPGKKSKENLLIIFCIFFIGGMGIYLGRYARWNSWDIIFSPMKTIQDFIGMIADPETLMSMIAAGLLFGIFLTTVYIQLFSVSEKKSQLNQ